MKVQSLEPPAQLPDPRQGAVEKRETMLYEGGVEEFGAAIPTATRRHSSRSRSSFKADRDNIVVECAHVVE